MSDFRQLQKQMKIQRQRLQESGQAQGKGGAKPKSKMGKVAFGLIVSSVALLGAAGGIHYLMNRPEPLPPVVTVPENIPINQGAATSEGRLAALRAAPAVDLPRQDWQDPDYLERFDIASCLRFGEADRSTPERSRLTDLTAEMTYTPAGALLVKMAHQADLSICYNQQGENTLGTYYGGQGYIGLKANSDEQNGFGDEMNTLYHELHHFWQDMNALTYSANSFFNLAPLQTVRFTRVLEAGAQSFATIEVYKYAQTGRPYAQQAMNSLKYGWDYQAQSAFKERAMADPTYVYDPAARRDLFNAYLTSEIVAEGYDADNSFANTDVTEGPGCERQQMVQDRLTTDISTGQSFGGICRAIGACDRLVASTLRPDVREAFAANNFSLKTLQCTVPTKFSAANYTVPRQRVNYSAAASGRLFAPAVPRHDAPVQRNIIIENTPTRTRCILPEATAEDATNVRTFWVDNGSSVLRMRFDGSSIAYSLVNEVPFGQGRKVCAVRPGAVQIISGRNSFNLTFAG